MLDHGLFVLRIVRWFLSVSYADYDTFETFIFQKSVGVANQLREASGLMQEHAPPEKTIMSEDMFIDFAQLSQNLLMLVVSSCQL